MKKAWIHIGLCTLIVVLAYGVVANPFSLHYIETLSMNTMKDDLRLQIEEHAEKVNIPPQDARIDKVWKALPGYNGLEVDVEKSYDKMKEFERFKQSQLVFKEAPPSVHLQDLPPAPTYRGVQDKPMVSLLINVAWGDEYIPDMLKTLKTYNVRATFFLDGSWVKKTPDLAKMIQEEGHEIGSHAYSHKHMSLLSEAEIDEELEKTTEVLQTVLDVTPVWFAPPSGEFNERVIKRAAAHDMHTIMWSVDTIDWKKPDPNVMVERVVNQIEAGSMLLMHPTASSSKGLARIIKGIQGKNLLIGSVTELMDEKRIAHQVKSDNNGGTNRD